MSSNKKNFKKEKAQKIDSEEENEIIEDENNNEPEEIEEENDNDGEEKEQEENEGEEENEEGKNKIIKEKDDLDERIATIGDASLKIQNIVSILSDFKAKREEGKSRSDYMSELKELCKSYYEYNDDICDLIFNLFPPNEAIEFMEASDSQKVLTIRTNSLKTKRRELAKNLIARGVNLDPLAEWSKVGLKIYSSSVPIGATPEYLSGQYMLQSASSFLPVLALDPHPGDKILDMCASPGGKTTYIGQLMKNEGLLVANDFKKERIKSLFFNIHRMGIKNSIVTNYDGREFAKLYNKFDRVLLDAPCSGLGVISKDKSVKMNRTYKEILNNSRLQKELILAAIDSCNLKGKGEGIIVYSTCTISVEENEWVIDYALKHRYVKCIETGLEIGEKGFVQFREKHFHPSIANARRIYPHIHNIDGFFIAKLKKYSDGPKIKGEIPQKENQKKPKEKENKNIDVDEYENNLEENSEPEDIQDQIKKGKLKDYNMNDNKKNKNKKKNKEKEDNEEDDGIFSGDEYEKVEEDIEKEAKNKKFKNDKIKNKKKENSKNNEKEKNEDIKKEKENLKNKNKNKKKDKKESKESEDEENIEEENTNKMKKEKDKKNKDIIFEEEKDEEKNEKINNKKITKGNNKKEKKLKEKKEEENEDINQNDKEEIKKKEKKERKESEGKEKEKKEEKLINKKRKASETNINNKDKSNKKKKNK